MTAAVAPPSQPLQLSESSAEARKRRREILASQRSLAPDVTLSAPTVSAVDSTTEVSTKRRKVADSTTKGKQGKKPQMKYDPDEPMTKEEAAAWRREQRRKRNRESAAASRQRQRDRISELEVEVEDWKIKFEEIMKKISDLEKLARSKKENQSRPTQSEIVVEPRSKFVSPPSSPSHSPFSSPEASPIASSSLVTCTAQVVSDKDLVNHIKEEQEKQHSDKMISRQAVKITGASSLPLFPSEEQILSPDACVSATTAEIKLEPIDSTLFPTKEEQLPSLLTDEENEDEFGEFLLDAVQWL